MKIVTTNFVISRECQPTGMPTARANIEDDLKNNENLKK